MTFDDVCQVAYPVFWLPGYYLITNARRRVGFLVAGCAFPFSIYTVLHHGQPGVLAVELMGLVILARGWWRARKDPHWH